MDQAAVVLGDEGRLLPLLCQPCCVSPLVELSDELTIWGVDSGVSHAVSGIEYEAVRAATFMGYKMICDVEDLPVSFDSTGAVPRWTDPRWNGYLSDVPVSLFRSRYEALLPECLSGEEYLRRAQVHVDPFSAARPDLTYRIRACTKYSVEENQRIRLFVELARLRSQAAYELIGRAYVPVALVVHRMRPGLRGYGSAGGSGARGRHTGGSLRREDFRRRRRRHGGGAGAQGRATRISGCSAGLRKSPRRICCAYFAGSSAGAERFGTKVV